MADTAQYYKVNVTGVVRKCLSCSLEKIRQKNVPKKNEDPSKTPGERMYHDMSSIRHDSLGGRGHWEMLVDEAMRCKHSFVLKMKSDQVDMISSWLKGLRDKYKMQVKFICCDHAEKKRNLKKNAMLMDWALSSSIQQLVHLNRIHTWKGPFQL